MTASNSAGSFAPGAGPGFSSTPLPADVVPVVLFWNGAFYRCVAIEDDIADEANWQKIDLGDIKRGEVLAELAIDNRCGCVTIVEPTRRELRLASGSMLMVDLTTSKLSTRPLRAD